MVTDLKYNIVFLHGLSGSGKGAGPVTQPLCEDLGFLFMSDSSFKSRDRNCIVGENGQGRGINLEQLQTACEFLANRLYRKTETRREIIFTGKE